MNTFVKYLIWFVVVLVGSLGICLYFGIEELETLSVPALVLGTFFGLAVANHPKVKTE